MMRKEEKDEIYSSKDWKKLNGTDRAQIILVAEGLKKGAITGGKPPITDRFLKRLGLSYNIRPFEYKGVTYYTYDISKGKNDLEKYYELQKRGKVNPHRANGEFLSYPNCCINEYSRKRTKKEIEAEKRGERIRTYKLGRQMRKIFIEDKEYPEYLDYCVPAFTPCSIKCKKARALLLCWKKKLDEKDLEASRTLKMFNYEENERKRKEEREKNS